MVEQRWEDIRGKQVEYNGHTWKLTGNVDVREDGDVLAVEAKQADDVKAEAAMLYFDNADPPKSLNPGSEGPHFDRLERDGDEQLLVVKKDPRRYRYRLERLEYA
ncbi:hypothetical protein VB779_13455 [Haloarculaceae archaeon H-GB11]|nr:hypothetical protein [Haloarculaceae archaeon H-GB11]